jgi:undecaprenyl-diphosphatase
VRVVARPALYGASQPAQDAFALLVGSAVSLAAGAVAAPRIEPWRASPTAAGLGLCVSGLALASVGLVPRGGRRAASTSSGGLSLVGAALAGFAHGLAVFPGATRVGAALTVLLWIGVQPMRAVELALLLTVPALVLEGARGLGALDPALGALAASVAFIAALLGSEALRGLTRRRRVGALALWILPLGLAMLAYARALPRAG